MKTKLAMVLLGGALSLALVDIGGLLLLREGGITARLVATARLDAIETAADPAAARILGGELRGSNPVDLMQRVMNMVPRVGPDLGDRLVNVYRQRGGGLLCAGMARIYFNALVVNGWRARIVDLRKSALDPWDSHMVVDQAGAWHIYDPTFNVAYARAGRFLGVEEIQRSLRDGSYGSIRPVFFGDVRYPARIDAYYLNWLPLFNDAFVEDGHQPGRLRGLPPLRYWLGPRSYYSTATGLSMAHLRLIGRLYFAFVALLPSLVLGLGVLGVVLLCWARRSRARAPVLVAGEAANPALAAVQAP
jgi:hypothetical protein